MCDILRLWCQPTAASTAYANIHLFPSIFFPTKQWLTHRPASITGLTFQQWGRQFAAATVQRSQRDGGRKQRAKPGKAISTAGVLRGGKNEGRQHHDAAVLVREEGGDGRYHLLRRLHGLVGGVAHHARHPVGGTRILAQNERHTTERSEGVRSRQR